MSDPTAPRTGRSVLICGASVAGPTLAYWLRRYGMHPIVVERAPEVRPGGQAVDIRGAARTVAERMGLDATLRDLASGEDGLAFVGPDNRVRAALSTATFGGEGFVSDLELLRGDLAVALHDATRDDVEYVFGEHVVDLDDRPDGVTVTLASGTTRTVDLVVAADGLRSRTRRMVFPDHDDAMTPLGLYMGWFTLERQPSDGTWARWFNAPGRAMSLRPDRHGTTKAMLSVLSGPRGWEDLPPEEQKRLLTERFADAGWTETTRVLRGLAAADDFYFEPVAQVHLPEWSRGRVALLGDAAYCASPVSGMGTALAMVGAYVLAGELAAHVHHRDAFAAYERLLRPYVAQAQKLAPGAPRTGCPRTRLGIACQHGVLRVATAPGVRRLTRRILSTSADAIALPEYTHLETTMTRPDDDLSSVNDYNKKVIEQFRENDGTVDGDFTVPLIILHTTGARSGKPRESPVVSFPQADGTVVVVASKAGAPSNPDWYHNIKAHPRVLVETGTEQLPYDAVELTGAEREAAWHGVTTTMSRFAGYQDQTTRQIPVLRLTRAAD